MHVNSMISRISRSLLIQTHRVALRSTVATSQRVNAFSTQVAAKEEPVNIPPPSGVDKEFAPKIKTLVGEISKLNLLEVADLNECLRKTLNIQAAPMMSMGAMAAPANVAVEEDDEGPKQVQTAFTVRLIKYDETKKVPLIKEIKTIVEGMNLVQAKKFVESVPQVLRSNITKEEAEKLQKSVEALGATAVIE